MQVAPKIWEALEVDTATAPPPPSFPDGTALVSVRLYSHVSKTRFAAF